MDRSDGASASIEDLLRLHAPQVLGALVRRCGHFDPAEDAVQEALIAAAEQWPEEGVPGNPRGRLIRVASRRLTDRLRSDTARRRREETAAALTPADAFVAPPPGEGLAGPGGRAPSEDDTLTLLFLCCHPALSPAAQIALTLRAVGGLTTAEIAREATMAQRISRAKRAVRGAEFRAPEPEDRDRRLAAVLQVLYLIFNEGYTATAGPRTPPHRPGRRGDPAHPCRTPAPPARRARDRAAGAHGPHGGAHPGAHRCPR